MSIHAFVTDTTVPTNGSPSDSLARPQRRIVHLCTRFAKGGSEQRLKDMIAALPHDEHIVIIGRDSDLAGAIDKLPQARVIKEPALLRSINPLRDPLALVHLRRHINDLKCDIVVTHQSKAGVLGRLAARAAGAPPVVHSLSMADFGPGYGVIENRLFRLLERILAKWTSAYAVVGSDLANRFGQIGVPRERMTIIRSAARLPRTGTSRSELRKNVATKYGLSPDRPWILYVGSLDQRKNVLDLPIMLQQVLQLSTGSAPMLIVAGAGPQEGELRSLVEKIGVQDDCRLLGYVADPGDLFLTTDAVVLLSRAEGLPQVLVQAAAAGTPFVSTDIDGADELLEMGASGSVVEMGDIVGAARALLPYLRWPAKKNAARIDLSSWNPVRVRADYRELFTAVLNPPKPEKNHGFVVAIVGSDGAGKSTLANAIADNRQHFEGTPVVRMYLGSENGPASMVRRPMMWAKRTVLSKTIR
ncbi:MAG: glycosyltransferase, partial [Acidimicrobiia bacterium]|nr:glycosyltransferase [Acidimicrobiia bacterium]NNL27048.1 glycosyltransferase [Acidimicrobiia bacterium]